VKLNLGNTKLNFKIAREQDTTRENTHTDIALRMPVSSDSSQAFRFFIFNQLGD